MALPGSKLYRVMSIDCGVSLAGMRPFIPEKDLPHFESFLQNVGLKTDASNTLGSVASARSSSASTSETVSSAFGSRIFK